MKPLMVAATTEATDDHLVEAARAGSDAAFEVLFRRYRDRIVAYARGIVFDHARAEDIVQDVFVSALRSLRSGDREITFKPWIYEIAKNASIDHLRRAGRASEVSIDSDDFSPVDEGRLSAGVRSTDAACSAREDMDTLRMAFNDLPEAQREVLVSRELEGLSYDKISSRTGLTRSAVESMLFRARRSLKDGFDDIATGERCQRMRATMESFATGEIGLRAERRLTRHLGDCAPCRREAVALGLDQLALGAPVRSRISRAAAFLPLPGFLRRWLDGGFGGAAAQGGAAEQGVSLAGKAAVLVAAAAIAGGAGVAHHTGAIGHAGGDRGQATLERKASDNPAGAAASPTGAANASQSRTGKAGAASAPKGHGAAHGGAAGGGQAGSAPGKGAGDPAGLPQGAVDNTVKGAGGTAGDTVNHVGGTVDNTVKGVGGTVDNTVKGVGGTVDNTVNGVGNTGDNTVKGLGTTVNQTVTGVTGSLPAPVGGGKQTSPPRLLP